MTYSTIIVPNQFPSTTRPIVILPTVSMTKKSLDNPANKQLMLERVCELVAENWGRKQLIHTVSYDWNNALYLYLTQHLGKRNIHTYQHSTLREAAIENYLNSSAGILLAPSLERGIDLPYDQCRVVIVTKIPYPYLGDKQVSARLHSDGGQRWYNTETIRSLVQMSGRGVRSSDDFCATYVLDRQFVASIWPKSKHLIPQWWKDAIIWDKTKIWW